MGTFQVDLRGMVDLLSRNLYSGPRVYVRELLQNAVDAISARRALDPTCPARVLITLDGTTLSCQDTGIGLTAEETASLLSTIGASSKRDELGLDRGEFLGQFGIGLLSCFMVSPEITVRSRSARTPDAPTVTWLGRADGTYELTGEEGGAAGLLAPGTAVSLAALPGEPWCEAGTVRALVDEFGSLLPVDIEVRSPGSITHHGGRPGPWETTRAEALAWCCEHLGAEPFDLVDLHVPEAGLRGVVAVMPTAQPGRPARHTVSVRRMLVSRSADDLVPSWAYFVRVVADAEYLHLTASRESLVDDDLLAATREAIGAVVRDWLERLARTAPTRLARFVEAHTVGLCSVAVDDPVMLELVAHHVPFRTTAGPLTLVRLAEASRTGRRVRYARTVDQFRALADVAASQGILLVDAGHAYEEELLAAVRVHPEALGAQADGADLALVDPGELLDALARCGPAEEAQAMDLLLTATRAIDPARCEVVLRRFEPATVPALYLPDPDLAGRQVARSSARAATGAWAEVLGVTDPFASSRPPRLVLNRASSLVARLVAVGADEERATRVLRGLYVQCLLVGHQPLGPTERAWAAQTLTALLDHALEESDGAARPTPVGPRGAAPATSTPRTVPGAGVPGAGALGPDVPGAGAPGAGAPGPDASGPAEPPVTSADVAPAPPDPTNPHSTGPDARGDQGDPS